MLDWGCQPYIYAELTFDAKSPLAQRELLFGGTFSKSHFTRCTTVWQTQVFSKSRWFDQIQNDVELRNFKYDSLDSLCNLTIENQLSVQSIHFPATEDTATYGESNADFDGTIDTLLGTNTYNLTNFVDDITVKSVLSVASLSIGTIGDITPTDSNTTTIGTEVAPFLASYVSETHIGDATITTTAENIVTIDKPLQITDPAGIILADGYPLNAMAIDDHATTTHTHTSSSR